MSFLDKIEHLQKKPEAVRRRVLFVTVATVMFLIIAIWVSTLRFSLNSEDNVATAAASPFSVFKNIFKEGVDSGSAIIGDGLNNIKNAVNIKEIYGKGKE